MKENKLIKKILIEVLEFSKIFFFALLISSLIKSTVVANAIVPTGSMEETVMTGSRILINRLAYVTDEPQRGDIVSFHYPDHEEELFLKRVMGIPGETIEGISGYIYINGVKLDEDYTSEIIDYDFGPFIIPEDCYFMMGDNRNNSWDSRYWQNHFVEKSKIIGKAEIEYYPQIKILK